MFEEGPVPRVVSRGPNSRVSAREWVMASASPKSCTVWVLATQPAPSMPALPVALDARQRIRSPGNPFGVKARPRGCRFNPGHGMEKRIRRRFASRDVFGAGDMAKRLAQPNLQNHVDFVPCNAPDAMAGSGTRAAASWTSHARREDGEVVFDGGEVVCALRSINSPRSEGGLYVDGSAGGQSMGSSKPDSRRNLHFGQGDINVGQDPLRAAKCSGSVSAITPSSQK